MELSQKRKSRLLLTGGDGVQLSIACSDESNQHASDRFAEFVSVDLKSLQFLVCNRALQEPL